MSETIADAALAMVGTPFGHQGRDPGHRLDCLGLLVHAIGPEAVEHDRTDYVRRPDAERVVDVLAVKADELRCSIDDAPVGSILVFRFGARGIARHFAIKTRGGMVHSEAGVGAVEHPISDRWRSRFWRAFAWRQQH